MPRPLFEITMAFKSMKSTSKWFKLEEIVAEEAEEEVEEAAEEGDAAGDFKSKRSTA